MDKDDVRGFGNTTQNEVRGGAPRGVTDDRRDAAGAEQDPPVGAATGEPADTRDSQAQSSGIRTLVRGGSLALVGYVAGAGLQLLLVLVVTHGLKADAAGVFFEAVALFTILSQWGELGADTGAVREVSRLRALGRAGDVRTALIAALIPVIAFGLLALALVFGFAHVLADAFFHSVHRDRAVSYLRLFALFLPIASACTVILAATRGFGTMRPYVAIQNIALPAARPLLVGVALVTGLGSVAVGLAWALPLAFALVGALVLLLGLLHRDRRSGPSPLRPSRAPRAIAAEFWRFAGPRCLAGAFGVTVTWLDVLLVGAYTSSRDAAIYAAASRLSVVGTYGLYAMGMALAPQFSRLLAGRHLDRVQTLYQVATWWIMALCWPLYVIFAVYGRTLMSMFGAKYVSGDVALLILALGGLVNLGTGNSTVVLLMSGHSAWNMFNAGLSLAVNVGLNLILIPRLGIAGAAIAWTASIVVNNLAAVIQVRVLLGVRPFGKAYLWIAASALLTYGALGALVRWQTSGSLLGFAGFCLVATELYLGLLWRGRDILQLTELGRSLRGASATA
jgi:O-antigen/teichoic acid export membrane protein